MFPQRAHPIKEDYLKDHREITPKMRSIVIDWLIEVQLEYQLLQETLHITVGVLDAYLQVNKYISFNLILSTKKKYTFDC